MKRPPASANPDKSTQDQPSPASFADLYNAYGRDVYRYAFYLCGNSAQADDLTAETFLRVWSSDQPVRLATVKAYLFAIARNLYLHELRGRHRMTEFDEATLGSSGRHELHRGEAGLEAEAEARQELRIVLSALQELPERSRTALLLRAEHGMPYEEIATLLNISVAAAKVKVHRARAWIAKKLPSLSRIRTKGNQP